MKTYEATEQAYKNGYAKGKADALKWIPVTERLPDVSSTHNDRWGTHTDSVRVLCVCVQNSGTMMVKEGYLRTWSRGESRWMIPGTIDSVTHWMPLPEPPKGE